MHVVIVCNTQNAKRNREVPDIVVPVDSLREGRQLVQELKDEDGKHRFKFHVLALATPAGDTIAKKYVRDNQG